MRGRKRERKKSAKERGWQREREIEREKRYGERDEKSE